MPLSILKTEDFPLQSQSDIVMARQKVRSWTLEAGLGIVDQTKTITAASELARNTVEYGGGGIMRLELLADGSRKGLRLTFEDQGPGIPDIGLALKDGYSSGGGLGLGLSGARRLMNEFEIHSEVGKGTRVRVVKWK